MKKEMEMLEASPMCPVQVANQTWWANVLLEHYGIPGSRSNTRNFMFLQGVERSMADSL